MPIDRGYQDFVRRAEFKGAPFGGMPTAWDSFSAGLGTAVDGFNSLAPLLNKVNYQERNDYVDELIDEGNYPEEIVSFHGGNHTKARNYDELAKYANDNLKVTTRVDTNEDLFNFRNEQIAKKDKYSAELYEMTSTGDAWLYNIGGFLGTMADPVNILLAPIGATTPLKATRGMYMMAAAGRGAAANVGAQLILEPFIKSWREKTGREYTIKDTMFNLTAAGVFGGTLSGVAGFWGHAAKIKDRNSLYRHVIRTNRNAKKAILDTTVDELRKDRNKNRRVQRAELKRLMGSEADLKSEMAKWYAYIDRDKKEIEIRSKEAKFPWKDYEEDLYYLKKRQDRIRKERDEGKGEDKKLVNELTDVQEQIKKTEQRMRQQDTDEILTRGKRPGIPVNVTERYKRIREYKAKVEEFHEKIRLNRQEQTLLNGRMDAETTRYKDWVKFSKTGHENFDDIMRMHQELRALDNIGDPKASLAMKYEILEELNARINNRTLHTDMSDPEFTVVKRRMEKAIAAKAKVHKAIEENRKIKAAEDTRSPEERKVDEVKLQSDLKQAKKDLDDILRQSQEADLDDFVLERVVERLYNNLAGVKKKKSAYQAKPGTPGAKLKMFNEDIRNIQDEIDALEGPDSAQARKIKLRDVNPDTYVGFEKEYDAKWGKKIAAQQAIVKDLEDTASLKGSETPIDMLYNDLDPELAYFDPDTKTMRPISDMIEEAELAESAWVASTTCVNRKGIL